MKETGALPALLEELTEVRAQMLKQEAALEDRLHEICQVHHESARNLAHYITLRRHDIRDLQERLTAHGLSSLGKAEADVLGAVDAVLHVLHRLVGGKQKDAAEPIETQRTEAARGWDLLEANTEALLGPNPADRNVRIMVTMPSEAAVDFGLVRDLLLNGMNCMRVNCAHDGPKEWAAMRSNLKRAILETGRECRILMDLGGPKLRTAGLEPGPAVVKYRPKRDAYGRVIFPARIFLTPTSNPQVPSAEADAVVPVPENWLAKLAPGDHIKFKDARGASRSLRVTEADGKNRWAESEVTSYLIPGLPLEAVFAKGSRHKGKKQARVGNIPRQPQFLTLRRGDRLTILRSSTLGRPAMYDRQGRLLSPATIGVAQPDFLDHVLVGEKIKLDDGKIGGFIRAVEADRIQVEIVQARTKGSKLRGEKGINLPESELRVSPLTSDDTTALEFIAGNADMLGYSFVRSESDVLDLQSRLQKLGAENVGIVLKIETRQAFEQLPYLLLAAMRSPRIGVMIARGDLAVECGYQRLAEVQEEILWICEAAHVPVIWATQVLESLAKEGVPSRSEITDAAAGVRAECVMLNKGPYIVKAVRALDDILRRMEGHQRKSRSTLRKLRLAELFQLQDEHAKRSSAGSAS